MKEPTQREAARLLMGMLYKDGNDRLFLPTDRGLVPIECCMDEVNARRDKLIGKDFRFTWPDLPRGAKYTERAQ